MTSQLDKEEFDKVVQFALERNYAGDSESALIAGVNIGARLYSLPQELVPKAVARALAQRRIHMLEQDADEAAILAAADAEFQSLLNASPHLKSQPSQQYVSQVAAPTPAPASGTWTLKQCVDDYMTESAPGWSNGTQRTYQSSFKKMTDGLGSTTPINDITAARFVKWRMTLDAELHPDTVSRDCGAWAGLFEWSIKRERYSSKNPIEKQKYSHGQRARLNRARGIKRVPFSGDDLKAIFATPVKKPCAHWLPRLSLYTGACLGELADMQHKHIREYAPGCWSMLIDDGKTAARRREIPLHPAIIRSGFIDYLADAKRAWPGSNYIFPHLKPASKNGRGNLPGRDFGLLKTALGMDKTKVFHSFRKTLISCLQYAGCIAEHRRQFVGHTADDDSDAELDVHETVYSLAEFDPARLAELIFPFLDFARYPGVVPEIGGYKHGMYDKFFANMQRSQSARTARLERASRSKRKKQDTHG